MWVSMQDLEGHTVRVNMAQVMAFRPHEEDQVKLIFPDGSSIVLDCPTEELDSVIKEYQSVLLSR